MGLSGSSQLMQGKTCLGKRAGLELLTSSSVGICAEDDEFKDFDRDGAPAPGLPLLRSP